MNAYQKEQLKALQMVRQQLNELPDSELDALKGKIADYLEFRSQVAIFLETHFKDICMEKCYRSRLSACCSKDGIIAFFADVVINALTAENDELDRLEHAIQHPADEFKCIFLSETGCLWQVKPIVCEMFLCDEAENREFEGDPEAEKQWEAYKEIKKSFTWPDKPVLFEKLESFFMAKGCNSTLMYIHNSPGLLRIKKNRAK
ncbi:MAG: hypothetical protein HF978_05005 [Desulfobacteraceae bacterium]|nr:hypothetical protein [Desulfobacteraceae bacterium]MBC2754889.1 hypothetical protein [Desulfobacteraceae bacterium]